MRTVACFVTGVLFVSNLAGQQKSSTDLWMAVAEDDIVALRACVATGVDLDAVDSDGRTALMLAAGSGAFSAARELLWAGAKAGVPTPDGRLARDMTEEFDLWMLLRAYAFLQERAAVASAPPARPNLVILFEPTVNYLHPRIAEAYHFNERERNGVAGVDDDENGFIDDAFGLNLVTKRGHRINTIQYQVYLENRETIGRIFELYNQRHIELLDEDEYESELGRLSHPLKMLFGEAQIVTPDFASKCVSLAHGSHVAGIVLENSLDKAKLHTMSWMSFEAGETGSLFETENLIAASATSDSFGSFFATLRDQLLEEEMDVGRMASRYVQTTGAGVVNMSMGTRFPPFTRQAEWMAEWYSYAGGEVSPEEYDFGQLARELYVANCASYAVLFYENPDVLFVTSAGNDGVDNDVWCQTPAYFAGLFPNVITVAATDSRAAIAGFSNYGAKTVNLGALGVNVLSTAIPEASVYMDGTSMATPAVAGAAAYVRAVAPAMKARELRRLLMATARGDSLTGLVESGGVLDSPALFRTATGSPAERAAMLARLALRAARQFENGSWSSGLADAGEYSAEAVRLDPKNGRAHLARAMFHYLAGSVAEARTSIDAAAALAPGDGHVLWLAAMVYTVQGDPKAGEALDRAASASDAMETLTAAQRALVHALRAQVRLAAGNRTGAKEDAYLARSLDPGVELPDEL